jgi:hypothetical protein
MLNALLRRLMLEFEEQAGTLGHHEAKAAS